MGKPRIYAYDCGENKYKDIDNEVDLIVSEKLPESMEGLDGIILHSVDYHILQSVIEEAKRRNILLIIQTLHQSLGESYQELVDEFDWKYPNLFLMRTYSEAFDKIRETFELNRRF